jgi:uncharacterized protein
MPEAQLAALLVVIALVAGAGITAVGPGGVFVTIALFALTPLSSAEVAGTALATFVATGLLGTAVYVRSGELAAGDVRRVAALVSVTGLVGALLGTRLNLALPDAVYGGLLAAFVIVIGVVIVVRELRGTATVQTRLTARPAALGMTGLGIGVISGLLGVGGPVVAVPVLVVLGVPMLVALAVAQVQSVLVSGAATVGYAAAGAVSVPYALLVGIPMLAGVVAGWGIAQRVPAHRLRIALGVVLLAIGPLLVLR